MFDNYLDVLGNYFDGSFRHGYFDRPFNFSFRLSATGIYEGVFDLALTFEYLPLPNIGRVRTAIKTILVCLFV